MKTKNILQCASAYLLVPLHKNHSVNITEVSFKFQVKDLTFLQILAFESCAICSRMFVSDLVNAK